MIQIGINGFGRIGRVVMRIAAAQPQRFRICGVNLRSADPAYMAYQLQYDSVFGPFPGTIEAAPNALIINGHAVYSESDASRIKWKNCGTEYIVESTGAFNTYYQAALHFAGAAQAVGRVIPKLNGRLTGMAFRVSCNDVSVIDLTARLVKPAGYSEICAVMKEASETYMKDMIGYTTDQVVSADILGNHNTCIFNSSAGIMLDNNFVKLIAWYDNEWGYSSKLLDLISYMYEVDMAAGVICPLEEKELLLKDINTPPEEKKKANT